MDKVIKVQADTHEEKQKLAAIEKTVNYSVISEQASDAIANMLIDLEKNGLGGVK